MSLVALFVKSFQQARCVRQVSRWRLDAPRDAPLLLRADAPRLRLPPAACSYAPRRGYNILSSKRGNKNHYKGKGAASTGHHTRKGGYRLLSWKLPDYVVPDLAGFEVRRRAGRSASRAAGRACAAARVWAARAAARR
jgi:hypothetical protein